MSRDANGRKFVAAFIFVVLPEHKSIGFPPLSTQDILSPHSYFLLLYRQVCGMTDGREKRDKHKEICINSSSSENRLKLKSKISNQSIVVLCRRRVSKSSICCAMWCFSLSLSWDSLILIEWKSRVGSVTLNQSTDRTSEITNYLVCASHMLTVVGALSAVKLIFSNDLTKYICMCIHIFISVAILSISMTLLSYVRFFCEFSE